MFLTVSVHAANVRPIALKCEHLVNPLGIDVSSPRLSWMLSDLRQGAKQTAYQIWIGEDSAMVYQHQGSIWESGKVISEKNLVLFNGKPLKPFTKYYWSVQLWDHKGKETQSAAVNSFETGMMVWKIGKERGLVIRMIFIPALPRISEKFSNL